MAAQHDALSYLPLVVVLLAAAVASVPLARRLNLSAVTAYLAAGVLIGPFGLGVFRTPETIISVSELGVVLLLFVIGLELEFSRLLSMRRAIFGLGAAQFIVTAVAIGVLAWLAGMADWRGAVVVGLALALSATSIALKILEERGDLHKPYGQRAFAILLFQDMAVVPLLALLPLLASAGNTHVDSPAPMLGSVALGIGAIAALVIAGRYLLNPLFRLLAETGSREVMTAASLLLVLGTALLMHAAGLSMALGAFLAGVLLAESSYRHELEADIEPFRGLLLALFFMGVGMGIDLDLVREKLWLILGAALVLTALKAGIVWVLFRATCAHYADALRAGSVLTAAGEFAFVLIPLGASFSLLPGPTGNLVMAIAAMTMLLGPPTATLTDVLLRRFAKAEEREPDNFDDAHGSVLVIGFGRFGQIVSQCLLARDVDVTILDNSAQMIQNGARFGFKVYYGDGTRLDVLRAAGIGRVQLVAICVDTPQAADRIVDLVRIDCPEVGLYVRSYDRIHSLRLIAKGVNFELRETFESALVFGQKALEALDVNPEEAREIAEDVRRRDQERLALQMAEGLEGGIDLMHPRPVVPEPLNVPHSHAKPLNPEAEDILHHETEFSG